MSGGAAAAKKPQRKAVYLDYAATTVEGDETVDKSEEARTYRERARDMAKMIDDKLDEILGAKRPNQRRE